MFILSLMFGTQPDDWLSFLGALVGAVSSFWAVRYQINKQYKIEIESKRPHIVIKDRYINIDEKINLISNQDGFLNWYSAISSLVEFQNVGSYSRDFNVLFQNKIQKFVCIENYSPNNCYDLMVTIYTKDNKHFVINHKSITNDKGLNIIVPSNGETIRNMVQFLDNKQKYFSNVENKNELLGFVSEFIRNNNIPMSYDLQLAINSKNYDELLKIVFTEGLINVNELTSDVKKGGALYRAILDGNLTYGNPSSLYNIEKIKLNFTTESNEKFEYIYSAKEDIRSSIVDDSNSFEYNGQYFNEYILQSKNKISNYNSQYGPRTLSFNFGNNRGLNDNTN